MAELTSQIKEIINAPSSLKVVSTLNGDGMINAAPKGSLRVHGENRLEYVEIVEASASYKNVVRSLWFDQKITVLVVGSDRQSYHIVASPDRVLTCGGEYEEAYRHWEKERGFDIAAVVRLNVESVTDLDVAKAIEKQKKEHFFFKHLDQLSKDNKEEAV